MTQNAISWLITAGAQKLLTLVASEERSIHNLEASDPLVGQALHLAASEAEHVGIPVRQIESVGSAVMAVAQAIASDAKVPPAALKSVAAS